MSTIIAKYQVFLKEDSSWINRSGYIDLTDKPGLGIELDEAVVKKYRVDEAG